MSGFSISTGLISGLDIAGLVDALSLNQQQAIKRLEARTQEFTIKKTGINALEASLLTLSTTIASLKNKVTFEQLKVNNAGSDQFSVTVDKTAVPGNYVFQTVQQASAQQSLSRGYADTTTQTIGTGTLTIAQGGFLDKSTLLETLNDGSGIRRGMIRVTDRSGSSAVIDLTDVISVDDVLAKINDNVDISVSARVVDGRFILEDTSGSTALNFTITDLNGGKTATDLGIAKSVTNSTLTGDEVYQVTENFLLEQLNDGNNVRLLTGAADIRISLADESNLEVKLDGSKTLKDVLAKINDHASNGGKVTAEISNGRLVLTDNTAGSGSLAVTDINNAKVTRQLGLDAASAGGVLTGNRLTGGLDSVLLRNLRGGQGIETLGEISITDRSGQTATIDLSGAETLTDVLEAINNAVDDVSGDPLKIQASINGRGNGLVIADTSGETASNLVISDVGGSTVAADLGITFDAATDEVESDALHLRFVNEATSVSNYAPDGQGIQVGMFQITDTAGNVGIIDITSAVKTVGDVIQRINANTSISVRAELNETGDGFVLIDEAAGAGTLEVTEFGDTTTAADLRLLGESYTGGDGAQRVSSRKVTLIDIEATDTLDDLVTKLNGAGSAVKASVFDDGSSFNSKRLSITSSTTGKDSRLLIDDGGLGLKFGAVVEAQDSLLRVGANPASAFLVSSSDNRFDDVVQGIDIDVRNIGLTAATVEVAVNTEKVSEHINNFVSIYNSYVTAADELTLFDVEANKRGILQGDTFVLRVSNRLTQSLTARFNGVSDTISSLSGIGLKIGSTGKLELDEDKLADALRDDLANVKKFFTTAEKGFGAKFEATLKSLTDIVDGTFTNEKNVLDASIDATTERISELNVLLESKKARLLNEFVQMENILSSLQSQQTALSSISSLRVNPAPTGVA